MKAHGIGIVVVIFFVLFASSPCFALGDAVKGRTIYEGFCVGCHGFNGAGDGPDAAGMNPGPTNLTDNVATANITQQDIERAVVTGKPGTAMKAFSQVLTKEDIENLFSYLRNLMGRQ